MTFSESFNSNLKDKIDIHARFTKTDNLSVHTAEKVMGSILERLFSSTVKDNISMCRYESNCDSFVKHLREYLVSLCLDF